MSCQTDDRELRYIDLFSGCGGLSLGMCQSGWSGMFALEKDPMAFETIYKNMIEEGSPYQHFSQWPEWLPIRSHDIYEFLSNDSYIKELEKLEGRVPLMVGGPPCQGFSIGGARRGNDARNELVFEYLKMVGLVRPDMVLIENVEGMARAFQSTPGKHEVSVLEVVLRDLSELGYHCDFFVAHALDAGVPQDRRRVITFAIKKEFNVQCNPAKWLEKKYKEAGHEIRVKLGLPTDRPITIGEAIGDLAGDNLVECPDSPKFKSSTYLEAKTAYQKYMRGKYKIGTIPNSHRFSSHGPKVLSLYKNALAAQKPGRLSKEFLAANKTKTQKKFLLGEDIYASTVTTHPDEHIHFKYPRNISLREMARLQSFPDDFHFYGRYTLNGERRKLDVSRNAQIGNAVPVFLGRALGSALREIYGEIQNPTSDQPLGEVLELGENLEFTF